MAAPAWPARPGMVAALTGAVTGVPLVLVLLVLVVRARATRRG
ncbi:hypothetical protein [Dactylosporangium sp. CA-092794]